MKTFKKPLIFTLVLLPFIIAGIYLSVMYSISSANSSVLDEAIKQLGSKQIVIIISMIQPILLAVISAFFGYIISEKVGLMRSFKLSVKALIITLILSLIGGIIFSLDAWIFAKWIPEVAESYKSAGEVDALSLLTAVLYGGLIEELMMRLFLMSLLVFLAHKIFFKKEATVPIGAIIGANVISALLFAAGHLPSTAATFGTLTPLIVFRCFLMNGTFGLVFGYLYRKYGIQYAIIAHMLFHIVARTVWVIAL